MDGFAEELHISLLERFVSISLIITYEHCLLPSPPLAPYKEYHSTVITFPVFLVLRLVSIQSTCVHLSSSKSSKNVYETIPVQSRDLRDPVPSQRQGTSLQRNGKPIRLLKPRRVTGHCYKGFHWALSFPSWVLPHPAMWGLSTVWPKRLDAKPTMYLACINT